VVDEVRFCFGEGGCGWVVPESRRMRTRASVRASMRARRMLH
jgi:hypothetical protein